VASRARFALEVVKPVSDAVGQDKTAVRLTVLLLHTKVRSMSARLIRAGSNKLFSPSRNGHD